MTIPYFILLTASPPTLCIHIIFEDVGHSPPTHAVTVVVLNTVVLLVRVTAGQVDRRSVIVIVVVLLLAPDALDEGVIPGAGGVGVDSPPGGLVVGGDAGGEPG